MLEKHSTGTTRCHEQQQQLDNINSSSPEPRLKIKISRLKDGSGSFSLHNGFSHTDKSFSPRNQKPDCNGTQLQYKANHLLQQQEEFNEGDETEEEDYNYEHFIPASKRVKLDNCDNATHSDLPQLKTHDEKPSCDKSSDKENKIALRTRNARIRAADVQSCTTKVKTCQRKSSSDARSIGCSTEADLLGPCQPGTVIRMPGMVWSDSSENGMLLFKTVWKDKPFYGMLIEVGQGEDWSFSKSRVLSSCPGSRYKRKCKKPREFRYVDSWQKKGKNMRQKSKARSCQDSDVHSGREDEMSADFNRYLRCPQKGCCKKFVNEIARKFHMSYSHETPLSKQMPESNVPSKVSKHFCNIESPSSPIGSRTSGLHKTNFWNSNLDQSKAVRKKRKSIPTLEGSDAPFNVDSEGFSMHPEFIANASESSGQQNQGNHFSLEDISDDENFTDVMRKSSDDVFYTSSLNPTSLVIRRALKIPRNDNELDFVGRTLPESLPDGRSVSLMLPSSDRIRNLNGAACTQSVIDPFSGMTSSTASSGFPLNALHVQVPSSITMSHALVHAPKTPPTTPELLTTIPVSDPSSPAATPSWLDHYPHSISAALTMSLLSMSKPEGFPKERDETFSNGEKEGTVYDEITAVEDAARHSMTTDSPATIVGEVPCRPESLVDHVPRMRTTSFGVEGFGVSSSPDRKPNCVSPVYSDISDTVDRTPLFANTSKAAETEGPEVPDAWSCPIVEPMPQGILQDRSKVLDWLDHSGYTSYLQQILCNKEQFYQSLAFGSPPSEHAQGPASGLDPPCSSDREGAIS